MIGLGVKVLEESGFIIGIDCGCLKQALKILMTSWIIQTEAQVHEALIAIIEVFSRNSDKILVTHTSDHVLSPIFHRKGLLYTVNIFSIEVTLQLI